MTDRGTAFRRIGLGLGLAAAACLFLWFTRSVEQYGDSLNYAQSAKTGGELFHPHHILYNAVVRGFYLAGSLIAPRFDAVTAGQIHNILWAAVAVAAVFLILLRWLGSIRPAIAGAVGLLIAQGFWEYATQTQIYVPAIGVLALFVLMLSRSPSRLDESKTRWGLAVLFTLAVGYHQSNILLAVPLAVWVFATGGRRAWKRLAGILVPAGILIMSLYLAVYAAVGGPPTLSGFLHYGLAYTSHPDPGWGTLRNINPANLGRAVLSQWNNFMPVLKAVKIPLLIASAVCLAALCLWHLDRLRRKKEAAPQRVFLLAWLAVHFVFFLWWSPDEKNMFIISLLPMILLMALAWRDWAERRGLARRHPRRAAAVVILFYAAMGAWNYSAVIRPLRSSRGLAYETAKILNAGIPTEGTTLLTAWNIQQQSIYYFGRTHILQVELGPQYLAAGMPLPEGFSEVRDHPTVLSPGYLAPHLRLSHIGGYEQPVVWRRWLEWLFGVAFDARGEPVSCRAFESIALADGYLLVRMDRWSVSGWIDFFARLDETCARIRPDLGRHSFQDWWRSVGEDQDFRE